MLNIGRKQKLVVVKKVEFGIYLGETREAGEKERVSADQTGAGRNKRGR